LFALFAFFMMFKTSFAAKIGDYIKVGSDGQLDINSSNLSKTLNSLQDEITKNINANLSGIADMVTGEIQKTTDRINVNIIDKAESLVKSAEVEFNDMVALKKSISYYLCIAKIIIIVMVVGLFLLVFVLWKNSKKLMDMAKIVSIGDTKAINEKLDKLLVKTDKIINEVSK